MIKMIEVRFFLNPQLTLDKELLCRRLAGSEKDELSKHGTSDLQHCKDDRMPNIKNLLHLLAMLFNACSRK